MLKIINSFEEDHSTNTQIIEKSINIPYMIFSTFPLTMIKLNSGLTSKMRIIFFF